MKQLIRNCDATTILGQSGKLLAILSLFSVCGLAAPETVDSPQLVPGTCHF
jgi:hypothetical protein